MSCIGPQSPLSRIQALQILLLEVRNQLHWFKSVSSAKRQKRLVRKNPSGCSRYATESDFTLFLQICRRKCPSNPHWFLLLRFTICFCLVIRGLLHSLWRHLGTFWSNSSLPKCSSGQAFLTISESLCIDLRLILWRVWLCYLSSSTTWL